MLICVNGRTLAAEMEYRPKDGKWGNRESVALTLEMGYTEAIGLFVDDVPWTQTVTTEDAEGNGIIDMYDVDMSAYAISGAITDNRDGTVTIKMGKHLPEEIIGITLAKAPKNHAEATIWRSAIETAMQSIEDDAVALSAAPLYPDWNMLAVSGKAVPVGFRFRHEGKLYKAIQAHTLQSNWIPGDGTESLYTCIDEAHSGTESDPIPYAGNMALVSGLYYTQHGVVYLCTRDTINPVYHALFELVGLYVEAVV